MRLKRLLWALVVLYLPLISKAQEKKDTIMKFSLNEAKAYAQANSPVVKNAALDLESARKKIWETTARLRKLQTALPRKLFRGPITAHGQANP